MFPFLPVFFFFFFNDTATTEIYTLSLHDALPIFNQPVGEYGYYGPTRDDGGVVGSSEWIWILDEDAQLITLMKNTLPALIECVEAMPEVLRISDRKHDAWDKAKAALAKLENEDE